MIKRLRRKFIRIAMLAVSSVMLLLCFIVNIANYISVNADLTQMLQVISQNQGTIPDLPPNGKPNGPFTEEKPHSTRYFVLRYTDDGALTNADLSKITAVTQEETGAYLEIAQKHGSGFGFTSGYKFYVVQTGENRNMAIFLDCYQEMRSVAMLAVLSLAAMLVCIALVYAIVVLFSRRAIDPVVKSVRLQKQFITDAGHELKTPITVLATSLKVLEMEPGEEKWIAKAQAQTEKLTELVNALVTLSRMDEEESPLQMRQFGISEAVQETAESFRDYAKAQEHDLNLQIAPDLHYNGDEFAIRQLTAILLENAIKYAVAKTPVTLILEKGKRGIVLRTRNASEPIEKEDLDRLFDRFYRTDKSRTGSGGFGIGLSIARSIAQGHKGCIYAKDRNDGMIEITAELK